MSAELWSDATWRGTVRLCRSLSGDASAAEDLAQETLLEAWRNIAKLRDPSAKDRWIAAIARNVCRRSARRRGREIAATASGGEVDPLADVDLERDLEREELAALLDRALALLPAPTRDVLVRRYVHESPHNEIGARLGISTDAVAMRLSRGKLVLRRVLTSQLRAEGEAYGLVETSLDAWTRTRVWCGQCGRGTLLMRIEDSPRAISFRCAECCPPSGIGAVYALENPALAAAVGAVVRPSAVIARAAAWVRGYFAEGTTSTSARCSWCGRPVTVRAYTRAGFAEDDPDRRGLYAECAACGEVMCSSLAGLAQGLTGVRAFRTAHRRTAVLPVREIEWHGGSALALRYEDLAGRAGIDVVFASGTFRVLEPVAAH